jgi:hypothetical protein
MSKTIRSIADSQLWRTGKLTRPSVQLSSDPADAPILLLGAGASIGCIPLVDQLKRCILEVLKASGLFDDGWEVDASWTKALCEREYLTLEVLCTMLKYRFPHFDVTEFWRDLSAHRRRESSRIIDCLARLRLAGYAGPIITTNFDGIIPETMQQHGAPLRFLSEAQLEKDDSIRPDYADVVALHGTVFNLPVNSPPMTATARGLARPFTPGVQRYLRNLIAHSGRRVLVIGYSGCDHFDVSPFLRQFVPADNALRELWTWVIHDDGKSGPSHEKRMQREQSRARSIIGPGQTCKADATAVLKRVCDDDYQLPRVPTVRLAGTKGIEDSGIRRTVEKHLSVKSLPVHQRRSALQASSSEVLMDLRTNLFGAWTVLEHYRLYSAGFDVVHTKVFSGTASQQSRNADSQIALTPTTSVDYGRLVLAQERYRIEDAQPGKVFGRSRWLFQACDREFRSDLRSFSYLMRFEVEAVLLVGRAIARDYLGLIKLKQGETAAALSYFEDCRQLAAAALGVIHQGADSDRESEKLQLIVQANIWMQIAMDNRARCLTGNAAVQAFVETIQSRERMILAEQATIAKGDQSTDASNYLIAHYPQQWLRASELIKVLFNCSGHDVVPAIPADHRHLAIANYAMDVCQTAFDSYAKWSSRENQRFPAFFEASAIYLYFQFSAAKSSRQKSEYKRRWQSLLHRFESTVKANPQLSVKWVENARRRFGRMEDSLKANYGW